MRVDLSVVVVGDEASTLERLFEALDAQTAKGRLELVVVAPCDEHEAIGQRIPSGVGAVRFEARRRGDELAVSRAAGLRAATAPVAVLTETHALPEPGWAHALVECHRRPCAAVGPTFVNGNPSTALSWANFLLDYGTFAAGARQGGPRPVRDVAGHNSAYKREALDVLGGSLTTLLRCDWVLHAELRRRGGTLLLDPAARVAHFNVTRVSSALAERWWAGRRFAAGRSSDWSRGRRALYAAGAPAVPFLRTARTMLTARRLAHGRRALRAMGWILIGVTIQSAGEAAGYAAGARAMAPAMIDIELRRFDHLARKEGVRALA